MHQSHNKSGSDECRSGSKKPAADNRYHPCDTEHRTFPRPRLVGQRAAHRHHKRDKCRRQRELHRCAKSNQRPGKHKVHGASDKVESGTLVHNGFIYVEAAVKPTAHSQRRNPAHQGYQRQRPANKAASYAGRPEHLVAITVATESYLCLGNLARLLRGGERHHHYHARPYQEIQWCACRSIERTHHKAVGISASVCHIILIRRQA